MTNDEKSEWLGDPIATPGANLFGRNKINRGNTRLSFGLNSVTATALSDGQYRYDGIILGPASDFEGKTVTLSIESIAATQDTHPRISLYWYSPSGSYETAGGLLDRPGSTTITLVENAQNRIYLIAFVYVSTSTAVVAGATVRYNGVMLTVGDEKYPFAPYTELVATPATKGAYNYSDLNRVETAVGELSDLYGLGLTTKTDWSAYDIPNAQDMDRYLSNIRRIRTIVPDQSSLPTLPTDMRKLTFDGANNIEKILVAAYEGAAGSYRSGELYSGEV